MNSLFLKTTLKELNISVRLFVLFLFLLFVEYPLRAQGPAATLTAAPVLLAKEIERRSEYPPALGANTSSQWYQQAVANLTEREYYFQPFATPGLYTAANHAQHIGFLFDPAGYTVKNILDSEEEKSWSYHFAVQHIGNEKNLHALPKLKDKLYTEETLTYDYGDFIIEYQNDQKGMRQNFVVNSKPAGQGKLAVVIQLSGDLRPSLNGNNQLLLSARTGIKQLKLSYDRLKVWDANQHLLAATMKLSGANKLVISVDDKNAVYPITIDPLNHAPNWTTSGNGLLFPLLNDLSTPVMYGYSVASAGDLNGDGFSDLIIGAPLYVKINSISGNSFNPVNVGAAFIYMGSSSGPALVPSEALQPTSVAGAFAGFSVSTAGDVDGDGFSDVMLSAPGDRISLTIGVGTLPAAVGRVYVYNGKLFDGNVNTISAPSATMSLGQPDFGVLTALPVNPLYGFSIDNAGDVNNDGFDDIVIGSPAYLDLGTVTLAGKVDVYYGSATGFGTTPNRTIKGSLLNGLFGFSVARAGKVNNDPYSDIIIGAPASVSLLGLGAAYVFHGSAAGITATSVSMANTALKAPGLLNQTLFGFSVSGAGDVNGDGRSDVIVGEPLSLESTVSAQLVAVGKAHIYYGSNSGIQSTGGTDLTSPRSPNLLGVVQGNLLFGYSVSSAGDIDCDGIADVVVGEPGGTAISLGTGALGLVSTNALSGSAYIFSGKNGTGPINTPTMTIQETGAISAANLIGYSVKNAGDVNGDGHADIIIGAPNGTLSLSSSLTTIVGNAIGYITSNSIGSAYVFNGCFFALLPIKLLSFTGIEQNGSGLLNWTTNSSEKNDHFDVERSINGIAFQKIGTVQAVPEKGSREVYNYTDNVLPAPTNYYRLKMINADGKSSYSNVIVIKSKANEQGIKISPNPARETVQLYFNNMPAGNYTLQMVNASGQTALNKNISLVNSVYEMKTVERTEAMPSGTYFIRLIRQGGQSISAGRVVLQ